MDSGKQREGFASRLGFILVSAGCAVGIGNVWRFPTVTGQNGGGVFVLFYLLFLVLMGVPVLTMELAVGRAGHNSAVKAYKALEPKGTKWHLHGWVCMIGCALLMMYYTTVAAWMLDYFFKFLTGRFTGLAPDASAQVFSDALANPGEQVLWMVVITVLGFLVCQKGLQGGLERIGKWMMGALLVLILVLVAHSFVLPGVKEGLVFYLLPDWQRACEQGLGNVITAAMNQSFFTLSLGIAAMEIFGSYMDRRKTCLIGCVALILLGLPCALGYNVWSFIQPMGAGSTVLDFEDFLVSNLLLPGGSLIYLLFCVTRWGWNFDNYLAECNTGSGFKMPCWLKNYFRFALPVLILVILVQGL